MAAPVMPEYVWLVVAVVFAGFGFGYATGSNDVANAFATVVGSKTLKLWQVIIICAIFEFAGAMILGRVITGVIAGSIADINTFYREPEMYAYGMVCALGVSTIWIMWASYAEFNVSSTHSIVGGIIAFSLVYKGKQAVLWNVRDPTVFPPVRGVVPIIVSWFFTPIMCGISSAIMFYLIRTLCLRRKNAYFLSFLVLPPFLFLTIWICLYFTFERGAARTLARYTKWSDSKSLWVSAAASAGVTGVISAITLPIVYFRVEKDHKDQVAAADAATRVTDLKVVDISKSPSPPAPKTRMQKWLDWALYPVTVDIHDIVDTEPIVHAMHARAEKFDSKPMRVFRYLQIFSSTAVIFSHGAGEVGQIAGPIMATYNIYRFGTLPRNVDPHIWVLIIGAFSLVLGLTFYGYGIMRSMGVRTTHLCAARGFAVEISAATVLLIASQYGLPTSSSQIVTGGLVGVGLMDGLKGVNWPFIGKQLITWALTLVVVGLGVAALFAQGIYAPGRSNGRQQVWYEDRLINVTSSLFREFNSTLQTYRPAATAGTLQGLDLTEWRRLNTTMARNNDAIRRFLTARNAGTVRAELVIDTFYNALALYQNYTVLTVGQNNVRAGARLCNNNVTVSAFNQTCRAPRLLPPAYTRQF